MIYCIFLPSQVIGPSFVLLRIKQVITLTQKLRQWPQFTSCSVGTATSCSIQKVPILRI